MAATDKKAMQNVQGKPAGAVVSSELAAMFAFAVIPTIRKHYYDPGKPGKGLAQYKRRCKDFAARIGLPHAEWPRVTLPCFLSFDWDTRHTYVRETLASERVPAAVLADVANNAMIKHLGPEFAPPLPPGLGAVGPVAAEGVTVLTQPVCPQKRPHNSVYAKEVTEHEARCTARLARYKIDKHVDLILKAKWDAALVDTRYITVDKRQYMPLSKVSPDIHSPVEHLVGTVKRCVREALLRDLSDAQLWKGKTYQDFINNAVSTRGNGEEGRHHVFGSVKKQILICKILAAEKSEQLTLPYQFKNSKMKTHLMNGTAGAWIRSTKWT